MATDTAKPTEAQIKNLVADLAHPGVYQRKHAAWTLARLAQRGNAKTVVNTGAVPKLVECLGADELIVRYRAVWALGMLAKHGQRTIVLDSGAETMILGMIDDSTSVEICDPHTSEIIRTTLGTLAREMLEHIHGES
ncbi:MAG: hypothetical protein KKH41_08860 [Candidatus Thermoplasmatota archaeon]|nr:hypothetical protein [Euryarchaeota archaeon]MBU4031589.1 hypothetical protein [Candidatus Thermoplasmatota archaeon]MBU4071636.1 hypothetical protein [Candidatus Thermoplasmatota archaeon]MBU4144696.1 hypothetical protein [Candidatus Thermoplasmatota archaeon]MBU4592675.1 hypothetical protein [Candidatus Thermoplasmatota archaeon]